MRILFCFVFISFSFFGCKTSKLSDQEWKIEEQKVERCRSKWSFKPLETELSIILLEHDQKGRYHLVSWPNFFIGVTTQNDTLGVIEYESEQQFKIGEKIQFLPGKRKEGIAAQIDSEMDEPIFSVSPYPKENDLYCAVKTIYYGNL